MISNKNIFFIVMSCAIAAACSYSFTGASVPSHLNTIAIPVVDDRSGSGEPGLRETFTDELIQKFINDNSLEVADRTSADAILEVVILSVPEAPSAVTEGENVETRRITISVKAVYRDLVKRETIFDKNFSNYSDFRTDTGNYLEARNSAIEEATDKLTEDILLGVVADW